MSAPVSDPGPSVESFALSSALLRDLVTSWVPSKFGVSKPVAEREKELAAVMGKGGRRGAEWEAERLGLGHPLLEPGADKTAGPSTARRDFAAIAKHLGKPGAESSNSKRSRQAEDDDDEEEETSRFRSVGKGKGKMEAAGVQALLNGKKKKKKVKREELGGVEKVPGPVAETKEELAPSIAPLAILKPLSVPSPPSSPEPDASINPPSGSSSGKTKAERRREAKKRRKEDKKKAHGQ